MKKVLLLGIMAAALLAAGTAHASHAGLSLNGGTGMARTPIAVALPAMTLAVAADYVTSKDIFVPLRVEFGVIDGLEFGGRYWLESTTNDPRPWGVNAKYVVPVQPLENLAIAVGGEYDSTSFKEGKTVSELTGYAVATYTLDVAGIPIVPSVGVAYDNVKAGDFNESGVRFFGSVAVMVLPNVAVGGEVLTRVSKLDVNNSDPFLWLGVRATPVENLTVQIGLINNANLPVTNSGALIAHVGAQYTFSFLQ